MQLAQTTMRSELGKITLDKTFEERDALNKNIVTSIQYEPVLFLPGSIHNLNFPASKKNSISLSLVS